MFPVRFADTVLHAHHDRERQRLLEDNRDGEAAEGEVHQVGADSVGDYYFVDSVGQGLPREYTAPYTSDEIMLFQHVDGSNQMFKRSHAFWSSATFLVESKNFQKSKILQDTKFD
jgi:hypothetical protein